VPVLTGSFGLSAGPGAVGFLVAPSGRPLGRGRAAGTPRRRGDLLSDAAFLDVGAGPFAAPVAVPVEAEAAPAEPVRPVIRPTPSRAPVATAPSEPEPPPAEDDQAPIITDEDVQKLDAEVQQIQAEKDADAATDTKKKKKNK
jgi:hypothetical protein